MYSRSRIWRVSKVIRDFFAKDLGIDEGDIDLYLLAALSDDFKDVKAQYFGNTRKKRKVYSVTEDHETPVCSFSQEISRLKQRRTIYSAQEKLFFVKLIQKTQDDFQTKGKVVSAYQISAED